MDDSAGVGTYHPADDFTITTLEALKVFSDPLRQQIIEALLDSPRTVKQIASELELVPTKLYYHINLLEEHGFIRVIDTRIVSGIIEKRYGVSARTFTIDRTLLSPGQKTGDQALDAALASTIERSRAEIRKSIQQGIIDTSQDAPLHRKLIIGRGRSRLSKQQAEEFFNRLRALMNEFEIEMRDDEHADAQAYAFMFAFYPLSRPAATGDTPPPLDDEQDESALSTKRPHD